MRKLILRNYQSPGDVVMLTAAVRDLHHSHPGQFTTDVRSACSALWEHNPFITPLQDDDPEAQAIDCEYPLIHESNTGPWHFVEAFSQYLSASLSLPIRPTLMRGDIHLSRQEKSWISQVEENTESRIPFWIVAAGGKHDFTAKWWAHERYQQVVDAFSERILFVQIGESGHHHPPLRGVLDLRGKTDLRQLVRLVYHSQGVLCPVTLLMHLAAAVETAPGMPKNRPCVVVAGGREPAQWEAYPHHQYIHANGALLCCDQGGCWKSRVVPLGDGDDKDLPQNLCVNVIHQSNSACSFVRGPLEPVPTHAQADAPGRVLTDYLPRCLDLVSAEEVVRRIEVYFAGGAIQFPSSEQLRAAWAAIARNARP